MENQGRNNFEISALLMPCKWRNVDLENSKPYEFFYSAKFCKNIFNKVHIKHLKKNVFKG